MKQLVTLIRSQIQFITSPDLKHWLLGHLNEDATNLQELFCKHHPPVLHSAKEPTRYLEYVPIDLSVIPIVFTYAPSPLRNELHKLLQEWPLIQKLGDTSQVSGQYISELNTYKNAWPIICTLKREGANGLISTLESSDESSLRAFARLTQDSELSLLVNTFLAKNTEELESITQNLLIQFLRQPDLNGWLARCLDDFISDAADHLSLRVLLLTFSPCLNDRSRIVELSALLEEYPFTVHLEVMWVIFYFYNQNASVTPEFLDLVAHFTKRLDMVTQKTFINGLSQDALLVFVEHCLKSMFNEDVELQHISQRNLLLFCSAHMLNKESRMLVRKRLEQLDEYLFNTPEQLQDAEKIWGDSTPSVRQLLVSPQFIAQATPNTLKKLSDRHSFYIATLEPDECVAFHAVDGGDFYFETLTLTERRINHHIMNHPESINEALGKKSQLLLLRLENSKSYLLYILTQLCKHTSSTGKILSHFLETCYFFDAHIRFDVLASLISNTFQAEGIIAEIIQDCQTEQAIKKESWLYNSAREQIAFLTDHNEAIALVDERPLKLMKTGAVEPNETVYDHNGQVKGFLTEEGYLRSAEGADKRCSAMVLAQLPEHVLLQSPYVLNLLLHHVLFENTITTLYEHHDVHGSQKQVWLSRQFSAIAISCETELAREGFISLMHYFAVDDVFELLSRVTLRANALSLFDYILKDEEKRTLLFSGAYSADFHNLLKQKDNAALFLAQYLASCHDKPWFAEGLSCFARYAKKFRQKHLLSESLALLDHEKRDEVLVRLIDSEPVASLVIKDFFKCSDQTAIQEVKNSEVAAVTQYFHKKHIVTTLQHLNKTSFWQDSLQYRFLLHIFRSQHAQLFSLEKTASEAWQIFELNDLTRFISRHLGKKERVFDKNLSIGHRILGELVFRCSESGQTSLFFNKRKFNPTIAGLSFMREFLDRLIDKFYLPQGIRERLATDSMPMNGATLQHFLNHELKECAMLRDWHFLMNDFWKTSTQRKLPIIVVYLLNYKGSKQPLLELLEHYFHHAVSVDYLHPVSSLLKSFPNRNVAAVVFDALEAAVLKNPQILDSTVLRDMAQYYTSKFAAEAIKSPQAELSMLIYFGQNKYYDVVRQGCEVLANVCVDQELKTRLLQAVEEAKVEKDLNSSSGNFYFNLVKFLKRLWNYGFNAEEKASKIVKFCDDTTEGPKHPPAEDEIKTPSADEMTNSLYIGFVTKRRQRIKLLSAIRRSTDNTVIRTNPGKATQTLFADMRTADRKKVNQVVTGQSTTKSI